MTTQDRRISKTRKAIYQAFLHLLNQKDYEAITVQEIINLADVGRSTFYSHYESKELLLDELCQNLFHHLFERAEHLSPQDYLAHIFQHFKKNQDHVTSLLLSKNDYFIRQLRKELEHDVYPMVADELIKSHPTLPHSSCFTNWKKSFGCHPLSKKYQSSIQTIESYLITLLLLSMPLS